MEDNRTEQREALEVLSEFNTRLLKNMRIIVKELSGARLDDTDQFLKGIVEAINWEVQVVNATIELLNEQEEYIDKEEFNEKIIALNDSIISKEDTKIAEAFIKIIPCFEKLGVVAAIAIS